MADQIESFKKIKKVAGLLRISTEKTDFEGNKIDVEATLKNHEVQMKAFFKEWGIELVLYKEVLSGGSEFEDRKALQDALKDLKDESKKFDALCVIELERLSRDTYVSGIIKKTLEDSGAYLIALSPFQVLDMNDQSDSLMYGLASVIAEHNRKIASNRVKLNKLAMAKQGLNSSGSVPYGYIRNKKTKRLEIETVKDDQGNDVESPKANVVRQIFKMYLDGIGQRTICDRLNDMGIKNNNGGSWVPNSLRAILTCPTYKGTLVAKNYVKKKGKMVVNEEDTVIIENNHEPIIEPEVWDRAQTFRDHKKRRSGVDQRSKDWNSKKHMSILDGLVFCGCEGCGRKSTIKYYAGKGFYIIKCTRFNTNDDIECTNGGISMKDVEKTVFELINKRKEELEARRTAFGSNDFEDRLNDLKNEQSMLQNSLDELEREMMAIAKLEIKYEVEKEMKGADPKKEKMLEDMKQENDLQRFHVQKELDEINAKIHATPNADQQIKKIDQELGLIETLENADADKHKVNAILKEFILRIYYTRELPSNYKSLTSSRKNEFPAKIQIKYID
jgi:site-specific DNA recombinase